MAASGVGTAAEKDTQVYRWASLTLKAGMYLSLGVMGVGLIWWLLAGAPGGSEAAAKGLALDRVLGELTSGNPLALLNVGVLLLLATPATTLLVQIVVFAAGRNWRYAGIATLVLAILFLGFALSMKWIRVF